MNENKDTENNMEEEVNLNNTKDENNNMKDKNNFENDRNNINYNHIMNEMDIE